MKMTRSNLKAFIIQEIKASRSVLLEIPLVSGGTYSYRKEDEGPQIDLLGQKLHHMARQADSLLQMVGGSKGEDIFEEETRKTLTRLADELDKVFKTAEYERTKEG